MMEANRESGTIGFKADGLGVLAWYDGPETFQVLILQLVTQVIAVFYFSRQRGKATPVGYGKWSSYR